MARTIMTRVAGHLVSGTQSDTTYRWEVEIDGHLGYLGQSPALRSVYESSGLDVILFAAMSTVLDWEATRSPYTGHTDDCQVQDTLDASDCDCYRPTPPGMR